MTPVRWRGAILAIITVVAYVWPLAEVRYWDVLVGVFMILAIIDLVGKKDGR